MTDTRHLAPSIPRTSQGSTTATATATATAALALPDIVLSDHARVRLPQRGISMAAVKIALTRGVCIRKQGLEFRVLRGKDIPKSVSAHLRGRIKNTVIVTKTDPDTGCTLVLTAYRNDRALKHIRLKPDGLL